MMSMSELIFDPKNEGQRLFEAETLALQSLVAGANVNPQDELAKKSPAKPIQGPQQSTELIYHLIDFIKSI
jgi:hypothetical protein